MGVRLIVASPRSGSDRVAMYDSVTGWAFGPIFSSPEEADSFLDFLENDARTYSDRDLQEQYHRWLKSDSRPKVVEP